MATFDYQGMQDTATELLEEFGGPAVLYVRTPTTYSPSATPENSNAVAPTQYNVKVAVVPLEEEYIDGKKYEWNDQYHGGTSVTVVTARAYMTAADTTTIVDIPEIKIDDYFICEGGNRFVIKTVSRIDPSNAKNCLFVLDVTQ